MTALLSIVCGALVGFSLGLVGGGGSTLATPLLLYVVRVGAPHVAIGTGSVAVAAAAFSNFATHAHAGHVRWRSAIVFAAVGVLGALLGSTLGKAFEGHRLILLFGCLLIVVGILMLRSSDPEQHASGLEQRDDLKVVALALIAGTMSGFFGIGGGFLIVPCLLFATRMPMIDAVGSSLLAVAAFSTTTAANYARSGLVDWPVAGLFVLGGAGGGVLGMRLAVRLCKHRNRLRHLFAYLVFAVAAYVIYRSASSLLGRG